MSHFKITGFQAKNFTQNIIIWVKKCQSIKRQKYFKIMNSKSWEPNWLIKHPIFKIYLEKTYF
jgi:hypothetical protein